MYFSSKCKINSVIPCELKGTDGNQEHILYAIKINTKNILYLS